VEIEINPFNQMRRRWFHINLQNNSFNGNYWEEIYLMTGWWTPERITRPAAALNTLTAPVVRAAVRPVRPGETTR